MAQVLVCNWRGNARNSITLEHIHPHLPARECNSPVSTISSSVDSLSFWRRYLARKINDNFQYPAKSEDGCHEMTRPQKRQNVEHRAHHHCGEDLDEFAGHQFPSKRFPEIQTFAVLGSLQKSIGVMSSGDTHRNKITRTLVSMDLAGGRTQHHPPVSWARPIQSKEYTRSTEISGSPQQMTCVQM